MRAALHSHCLCWFQKRDPELRRAEDGSPYNKLPYIQRSAPGTDPKQRPRAQVVEKLNEVNYQEDNMYHDAEVARIVTEMVRPFVRGDDWGGFGYQQLRVAGLARDNPNAALFAHMFDQVLFAESQHVPVLLSLASPTVPTVR